MKMFAQSQDAVCTLHNVFISITMATMLPISFSIASGRIWHLDLSMATNIESIFAVFIPIPENKDTR